MYLPSYRMEERHSELMRGIGGIERSPEGASSFLNSFAHAKGPTSFSMGPASLCALHPCWMTVSGAPGHLPHNMTSTRRSSSYSEGFAIVMNFEKLDEIPAFDHFTCGCPFAAGASNPLRT